ncbi:FAD-binding oxidoreductase [Amycolatopsis oliviviridis]|uniref:FAD-dependent oxidoreductase n=1 Tax=Amycolatopsis oliviviridis TaxID=1471590 RepID=A0ABQ3L5H6_9PSEU|nr:FAD-binding oxidoreductase [Amycolatopsis oliviviridis]GHH01309.1 FAD-dependent oxidoreductase [Amycolatopsis oliviviridis]
MDQSEAVVIGGGIMGLSAALHLLEAGVPSVRLLERDGLCEGTTGAGGGFLAPWTVISPLHGADSPMKPIEHYGMEFYAKLHADGHDVDYRRNGVLWVTAMGPVRDWDLVRTLPRNVADPDSLFAVDRGKLSELTHGLLTADGVHAAYFMPSGSQVTTSKAGAALAERIRGRGGVIDTRRPATGIHVRDGKVTGVGTATGDIDCDLVVTAAGAWSNTLLEPLGVYLPGVPQVTSRIITEDLGLPDTTPIVFLQGLMPDEPGGGTLLWVRWHDGGLLWGGQYHTFPRDLLVGAAVPDRLDEMPLDGVLENLRVATAARFMPSLAKPSSIRVRHGVPCYTPDNLALVGAVPGIDGLYAMGGDNELGVIHGPGFAKMLADHIVHGTSDLADWTPWRLDRFGDRYTTPREAFAGLQEFLGALAGSTD